MTIKFKYLLPVFSFIFFSSTFDLDAQSTGNKTVHVGDRRISGSFIKPYKNFWKLTYAKPNGDSIDACRWSDEVQKIMVNGKALLKRTQIAKYNKGGIVTTLVNVFDPKTMEPISRDFRRNNNTYRHIDFLEKLVKYEAIDTSGAIVKKGEVVIKEKCLIFLEGFMEFYYLPFHLKLGYGQLFRAWMKILLTYVGLHLQ